MVTACAVRVSRGLMIGVQLRIRGVVERFLAKREAVNGYLLLKRLGDQGKRVWLLVILVGVISLYLCGYYIQQRTHMPSPISISPKLYSNTEPAFVALGWSNIGRKPVIGGRVLLFTVDKNITRWKKIRETPIKGSIPGNNGFAELNIDMHQSFELFLICATYVDDNSAKYEQVYLYRLGPPTDGLNEIPLVEEHQARPPSPEVCTEINSSGQALEGASR